MEPTLPFPNRVLKRPSADNTIWATEWDDRSRPEQSAFFALIFIDVTESVIQSLQNYLGISMLHNPEYAPHPVQKERAPDQEPRKVYLSSYHRTAQVVGNLGGYPDELAVVRIDTLDRTPGYYIATVILSPGSPTPRETATVDQALPTDTFVMGTLVDEPLPGVSTMQEAVAVARQQLAIRFAYMYQVEQQLSNDLQLE